MCTNVFFFPPFCDVVAKVAINLENYLAKFGYILDMKVKTITESFYILHYALELIIKIWRIGFF